MARRRSRYSDVQSVSPLVKLWLLRLLVELGGHKDFINSQGFNNDSLAELIGLGDWIDSDELEFDAKAVRNELRRIHRQNEADLKHREVPRLLKKNISRLSELVGLSSTDEKILAFSILIHVEPILDDTAGWLGTLSSVKVIHMLSVVLDVPERQVREALRPDGALARSGLVNIDRGCAMTLRSKLELLSDRFADYICSSDADPVSLLRGTVTPAAAPELELSDFPHVETSLAIALPYLRHALASRLKGVNLFIHGLPGTGKSQLVRTIAQELGCDLFEVASEDDDGDPVNGERRLRAFRATQSFFANQKVIVQFDEAEDVFNDGDNFYGRKSTAQTRKAWVNRILEENTVPTIWLSNSVASLDPAFIRRFDMVFELPIPPKHQREKILRQACGDIVNDKGVARIAESEVLAPAVVTRAASVVRTIFDELGQERSTAAIEHLISNTLGAQGHQPIRKNNPNNLPEIYDPRFINADADLVAICDGLMQSRSGRLCFYGPPGTGKTAYGRWLAEKLGMPLLIKRASDLVSMWVGGTEKNIAAAFRQAERDGALLLIDEVDSFLQDRRNAVRSWEVTEVNEMLTQVESYAGVLAVSTNLMSGLDQAALRRFDIKVKFDFLRDDQSSELLRRYCATQEIFVPDDCNLGQLSRLKNLTPGDFAAVFRQTRFRPLCTAVELVTALEAECAIKEGARSTIGFV